MQTKFLKKYRLSYIILYAEVCEYTAKFNWIDAPRCVIKRYIRPGPNFIKPVSTKNCLAWNFCLDKNKITNQILICCILLVTDIQLLFAYPENHVEISGWESCFYKGRNFMLSKLLCLQALWNWAQGTTAKEQGTMAIADGYLRPDFIQKELNVNM